MSEFRFRRALPLLAYTGLVAATLAPLAQVQAATCPAPGGASVTVGTVSDVAPGAARSFAVELAANEGVIVDLVSLKPAPRAAASSSEDEHDHGERTSDAAPRALRLCDAGGAVLAPQPGEVFEKGGSVSSTSEGERLRFVASRAGRYTIAINASDEPREVLVRRRPVGASAPVVAAQLPGNQKGITSSGAPMVFSFTGTAGQWVLLKATSEKDTVLRLAGPDKAGDYSKIAENDDTDGLNPVIRRKLPVAGTYYVQVDSLSDEPGEFELSLAPSAPPPPPPAPIALRAGTQVAGRLAGTDDIKLYTLSVVAGRSYRLDLTAPYDGVVGIGLPNPVEPEDGGEKADAGYADIKSQDSGTTGTEKLNFTARSSGTLLVRIKSFGIGETDGGYTLTATDLGS